MSRSAGDCSSPCRIKLFSSQLFNFSFTVLQLIGLFLIELQKKRLELTNVGFFFFGNV
jgi:hypothetical protein